MKNFSFLFYFLLLTLNSCFEGTGLPVRVSTKEFQVRPGNPDIPEKDRKNTSDKLDREIQKEKELLDKLYRERDESKDEDEKNRISSQIEKEHENHHQMNDAKKHIDNHVNLDEDKRKSLMEKLNEVEKDAESAKNLGKVALRIANQAIQDKNSISSSFRQLNDNSKNLNEKILSANSLLDEIKRDFSESLDEADKKRMITIKEKLNKSLDDDKKARDILKQKEIDLAKTEDEKLKTISSQWFEGIVRDTENLCQDVENMTSEAGKAKDLSDISEMEKILNHLETVIKPSFDQNIVDITQKIEEFRHHEDPYDLRKNFEERMSKIDKEKLKKNFDDHLSGLREKLKNLKKEKTRRENAEKKESKNLVDAINSLLKDLCDLSSKVKIFSDDVPSDEVSLKSAIKRLSEEGDYHSAFFGTKKYLDEKISEYEKTKFEFIENEKLDGQKRKIKGCVAVFENAKKTLELKLSILSENERKKIAEKNHLKTLLNKAGESAEKAKDNAIIVENTSKGKFKSKEDVDKKIADLKERHGYYELSERKLNESFGFLKDFDMFDSDQKENYNGERDKIKVSCDETRARLDRAMNVLSDISDKRHRIEKLIDDASSLSKKHRNYGDESKDKTHEEILSSIRSIELNKKEILSIKKSIKSEIYHHEDDIKKIDGFLKDVDGDLSHKERELVENNLKKAKDKYNTANSKKDVSHKDNVDERISLLKKIFDEIKIIGSEIQNMKGYLPSDGTIIDTYKDEINRWVKDLENFKEILEKVSRLVESSHKKAEKADRLKDKPENLGQIQKLIEDIRSIQGDFNNIKESTDRDLSDFTDKIDDDLKKAQLALDAVKENIKKLIGELIDQSEELKRDSEKIYKESLHLTDVSKIGDAERKILENITKVEDLRNQIKSLDNGFDLSKIEDILKDMKAYDRDVKHFKDAVNRSTELEKSANEKSLEAERLKTKSDKIPDIQNLILEIESSETSFKEIKPPEGGDLSFFGEKIAAHLERAKKALEEAMRLKEKEEKEKRKKLEDLLEKAQEEAGKASSKASKAHKDLSGKNFIKKEDIEQAITSVEKDGSIWHEWKQFVDESERYIEEFNHQSSQHEKNEFKGNIESIKNQNSESEKNLSELAKTLKDKLKEYQPPPLVSNVQVEPIDENKIRLTWENTHPTGNETEINKIEIVYSGNGFSEKTREVNASSNEVVIDGLIPGKEFTFRIKTKNKKSIDSDSAVVKKEMTHWSREQINNIIIEEFFINDRVSTHDKMRTLINLDHGKPKYVDENLFKYLDFKYFNSSLEEESVDDVSKLVMFNKQISALHSIATIWEDMKEYEPLLPPFSNDSEKRLLYLDIEKMQEDIYQRFFSDFIVDKTKWKQFSIYNEEDFKFRFRYQDNSVRDIRLSKIKSDEENLNILFERESATFKLDYSSYVKEKRPSFSDKDKDFWEKLSIEVSLYDDRSDHVDPKSKKFIFKTIKERAKEKAALDIKSYLNEKK